MYCSNMAESDKQSSNCTNDEMNSLSWTESGKQFNGTHLDMVTLMASSLLQCWCLAKTGS
jgi:hypothetical protein